MSGEEAFDKDREIEERQAANFAEFMELGPGLRYSTRTWVVARDRSRKKMLLGGLGGLGVGQMWFADDGSHKDDSTYADAPEVVCSEADWPTLYGENVTRETPLLRAWLKRAQEKE